MEQSWKYTNHRLVILTASQCNMTLTTAVAPTENKNMVKTKKIARTLRTEEMVKALDSIPWKNRQWGHSLARNAINAKWA